MKTLTQKTALLFFLTAVSAPLMTACDGDGGTGGGGTGATTTDGGGGAGATGGGGADGGGGTGGMTTEAKPDGDPCLANSECDGGFCLTQAEQGFPNGYCTGACNSLVTCDATSECISYGGDLFCFKTCSAKEDCGSGQQCLTIDEESGLAVCAPGCTMDKECEGYGKCDTESGFCYVPEDCDAAGDEDADGLADCEDSDCATKCQPQIDAACTAATAVTITPGAPIVQNGDNSGGMSLLAGTCSGSLNKEDIYKLAMPADADGLLDISLLSDIDLAVYAGGECGSAASELACADGLDGGTVPETVSVATTKGQTLYVYVDGSNFAGATGNEGPYTLTFQFIEPSAETEPNNEFATANDVSIASLPVAVSGNLDQETDDDDWFLVDTSALAGNKTITAETTGIGGDLCAPTGDIDSYLEILEEDGATVITSNDDISGFTNWCSLAEAPDLMPGKYYIHVKTSSLCTPDPMGPDCVFKYALKVNVK